MDAKWFYGKKNSTAIPLPNGLNSDDDNLSDENDFNQNTEFANVLAQESDSVSENSDDEEENDEVIPQTDLDEWESNDEVPLATLARKFSKQGKEKKLKKKLRWEEKFIDIPNDATNFKGSELLPPEIDQLEEPFQFFKYLLTPEIISYIVEETNIYSIQVRPEKPANITQEEICLFIGICIYMSIIHLPSTRAYWNSSLDIPAVSQTITCNRFEQIKQFLHFNNNTQQQKKGEPRYDKLFKIRSFLSKIKDRLLLVPKEEFLAVDEQIIPTKARSSIKQYNPKKPHKWGYKVYILSGVSGFSYDFEIFAGPTELQADQLDLGASSNVVVKLAETVPRNQNYKLFFDNWFTSVPLLVYLTNEGIQPLGTVRLNRVPNCDLPKESELKKRGRGSFIEKVANVDGVDVTLVCWYDNKVVTTASTYVGSQPVSEVRRFSRKDKMFINIPRPKSIEVYNSYMGGVDLLDSMLGYYRILIRSKKWYMRIFFHFIDMICVNAWLLWRRTNKSDVYLPLSEFKLAIAEVLTKSKEVPKKRGRPSNSPKWGDRQRYKYPECSSKSFILCEK